MEPVGQDYSIEKIIKKKKDKDGHVFYFLKWEGYPDSENTWEPVEHIKCQELIDEFEAELKAAKLAKRREARKSSVDDRNKEEASTGSPREPLKPKGNNVGPKRYKLNRVAAKAIAEMKNQHIENGLTKGYLPIKIEGATIIHEKIHHLVSYRGIEDMELIPSPFMRLCYPSMLVSFYEKNLTFERSETDDENPKSPEIPQYTQEQVTDVEFDEENSTPPISDSEMEK